MKVVNYSGWVHTSEMDADTALINLLGDTGYDGGRLEEVERRVEKLATALVAIFNKMEDDDQLAVLNALGSGWEKVS